MTSTPAQSAPSRTHGQKSQSVAPAHEQAVQLVTSRSPRKLRAKGGDIMDALTHSGFDVHPRAVQNFPRSCSGGHEIVVHTLELAPRTPEMPIAKAIEIAASLGLTPACGCKFGEYLLELRAEKPALEPSEALPDVTFFTVITPPEGGEVMATAAMGQVHTIKSIGLMRTGMVLVLIPTASTVGGKRGKK